MIYFTDKYPSLTNYYRALGKMPLSFNENYMWVRYEKYAAMRFPYEEISPIKDYEISRLFWQKGYLVASCAEQVNSPSEATGLLYIVKNRKDYRKESLSSNTRSKINRGLRRGEFREISFSEVAKEGFEAYKDSRKRNQLTDAVKNQHEQKCIITNKFDCNRAFGIYREGQIAAWVHLLFYGSHILIHDSYSRTKDLKYYVNNALIYCLLNNFIANGDYESLCWGYSSIQKNSNYKSLHKFKMSMGFEYVLIRRMFRIHPLVKVMFNPFTRFLSNQLENWFNTNKMIRKINGVMQIASKQKPIDIEELISMTR